MDNKESQKIEYKQTWRNDYLKIISSFANSYGGILMIGLDDDGETVKLKNKKKLLEDIPNTIRNKLGIVPSVEIKKDIIKVKVNQSSVPVSYNGKYYIRSGSTVQLLQGKELADFLLEKSGRTWDGIIEDQANIDDIDENFIEAFKKYAVDRLPSITKDTDTKILLQKLKLTDGEKLKRATVLLFGKNPQQLYPQATVKIGKFLSETDIQTTDIIKGNLFQQFENVINTLRTKYLVSNIKYEGIHRRDILEYPYEALREAIINALIHRDYQSSSNIQIRIYQDKLIIMNAGNLPTEVPLESLKTEHLSKPKNKLLADIFYYAGFIEAWGRGTILIVEKCLDQGLPEPEYKAEHHTISVIFFKDKWNEENLKKINLNDRQIRAVTYVKENVRITNSEYQGLFEVSKRTATNDLDKLVKKGLLKKTGTKGRGTHYEINKGQ